MKRMIKKIWDAICSPFVAVACFVDECKLANEDGEWDTYWARKNAKKERR